MLAINDAPQAIHVNALIITALVGTLIPVIVGIVTKSTNKYKDLLLVVLNAVSAAIVKSVVPDGGATFTAQTVLAMLAGIVASMATYRAVLAPTGVTNNPAHNPEGKASLGADKGL